MGLLDGDLIDPRLVDPVDDCVSQFTHQLKEPRGGYMSVLVAFGVKYDVVHDIITTLRKGDNEVFFNEVKLP